MLMFYLNVEMLTVSQPTGDCLWPGSSWARHWWSRPSYQPADQHNHRRSSCSLECWWLAPALVSLIHTQPWNAGHRISKHSHWLEEYLLPVNVLYVYTKFLQKVEIQPSISLIHVYTNLRCNTWTSQCVSLYPLCPSA